MKIIRVVDLETVGLEPTEDGGRPTGAEAMVLQRADAGIFWAFGPALSRFPRQMRIGPVATTHIQPGGPSVPTPPPPERVRAVLASLAAAGQAPADDDDGCGTGDRDALDRAQQALERLQGHVVPELEARLARAETAAAIDRQLVEQIEAILAAHRGQAAAAPEPIATMPLSKVIAFGKRQASVKANGGSRPVVAGGGMQRMLEELAAVYPGGLSRRALGLRAGVAPKGGTFTAYLSRLKNAGKVDDRSGLLFAMSAGNGAPSPPEDRIRQWVGRVGGGPGKILAALADAYPDQVCRSDLGDRSGFAANGGTFTAYLSRLRSRGLIDDVGRDLRAASELMAP